jgi:YesN/AraC family two-component response regulator
MARVLIIDDDDGVRALLRRVLERADHDVTEAADGKQGLRQFHQVPADLIIVDIFMPEKEGLDTILEIREVAPHVKTIAISGGGMTGSLEYLDYADTFGVDRTFTKPLDLEEVVKEVARLLVSSSGKQESD